MPKIVALDTNVLIWGIKKDGEPDNIRNTEGLLQQFHVEKCDVIVPALVIAELLMRIPSANHATITDYLQKSFIVAALDISASIVFSHIWQTNKNDGLPHREGATREKMKIDFLVVAIAVSRKAEVIYSDDPHVHAFGKTYIDVQYVPPLAQPPLI